MEQQVNYSKFTFSSDESVPLMKFGNSERSSKKVVPNRYSTSAGDQDLGSSAPLGCSSNLAEISEGPSDLKAIG